jgi:hypothetical protein
VPLIRKNKTPAAPVEEVEKSEAELLAELLGVDSDLRRQAANALGARQLGTADLAARLAVETDRNVREAIGSALLRAASDQSAMAVAPLLSSDNATLRNEARELLHNLPNAEMVAEVLLAAGDPDVRMFALEILGSRRKDKGAARIAAALRGEHDINVLAHGVEQLGLVGTAAQLSALDALEELHPGEDFLLFTIGDTRSAILARIPHNTNGSTEDS